MQTLGSDFLIEVDAKCGLLVSALVVRDACGIPVAEGTPGRLLEVPAPPGQLPAIDDNDWFCWWQGLLGDIKADRMPHPYSGAPSRLVDAVESARFFDEAFLRIELLAAGTPGIEALHAASQRLVQEPAHGLHGFLHVAVLPTIDARPLFTAGVLLLSHPVVAALDVESALALLRRFAGQGESGSEVPS